MKEDLFLFLATVFAFVVLLIAFNSAFHFIPVIFKRIKQLFCKHKNREHIATEHTYMNQEDISLIEIYKCKDCGKKIRIH